MIHVQELTKTYRVPKRASGLKETLRALVHRETETIEAVRDLTFTVRPGEMIGDDLQPASVNGRPAGNRHALRSAHQPS